MIYAGIGSRATPEHILEQMKNLAIRFSDLGYTLRSGGASGADTAFEMGALSVQGNMEIFIPWHGFGTAKEKLEERHKISLPQNTLNAIDLMVDMNIHKYAKKMQQNPSNGISLLHARNMMQILGEDLDTPVDFVVFYAEEEHNTFYTSSVKGGTATAVKLARKLDIPTFNLFHKDGMHKLESFLLTRNLFGF